MKPTVGRIVHYALSSGDADAINVRRADFRAFEASHKHPHEPGTPPATGHIAHVGNPVTAGEIYPAVIVRAFGGTTVNLQVLLDGNDHYWATSRAEGHGFGHWAWPVIEHPEPEEAPAG